MIPEVCYLLGIGATARIEATFLRSFGQEGLSIEHITDDDLTRIAELIEIYADLRIGSVDAGVIAVAERLGAKEVATLDHRHFTVVRPRHVDAFTLLP